MNFPALHFIRNNLEWTPHGHGEKETKIKMVRGTLGNIHQGCNIFQPFNGVQCTAIALIALLSFMQFFPHFPDRISREFIDGIMFDGNDLYREIVSQPGGPMGYLSHRDLPTRVELFDGNIEFIYDMFYGTVNGIKQ